MTEAQFELMLGAFREQHNELRAIKGNDTTPSACSLHVREGGDAAAFGLGPQ
jgi:hypothetical protein